MSSQADIAVPRQILPVNSTSLEKAVTHSTSRIENLSVGLSSLWDPWHCPVQFLPWLAHGVSVDAWDSTWPEQVQRQVIAASVPNHRIKGTVGALKQSLQALDADLQLQQWWEIGGPPHSARVLALAKNNLDENGVSFITPKLQAQLWQAIAANKPARTQIDFHIGIIQEQQLFMTAAGPATSLSSEQLQPCSDASFDLVDLKVNTVASVYEIGSERLQQNADGQFESSLVTVQGVANIYKVGTEQLQQTIDDCITSNQLFCSAVASQFKIQHTLLSSHSDFYFSVCGAYASSAANTTTFNSSYMEIL